MATAKYRVAIVEDDRDTCAALQEWLQAEGHAVFVAHDAPQGLAMIEAQRPEVALIDMGLPGQDGCALARQLRERAHGEWQPHLIAISANMGGATRARARAAGFDTALCKPFCLAELRAALTTTSSV